MKKRIWKSKLKRAFAATVSAAMIMTGLSVTDLRKPVAVEAATSEILSNSERGVIYADSRTDFRDESIYFVITTRFYDGDPSNNEHCSENAKANNPDSDCEWRGDFAGLIEKLDYIKALGFTAVWITPVVQNDSGYDYHGYHAYDFSAVDYRYESNGITYQTLIDAVHAKGMKLIQDVVLNHTCNWGEKNLLQLTSDIYSERNQTVMNGSNDPENIYHHNGFCGGGDWDNYSAQNKTIADDCFDLETENPKVYNYLVDCYTKYINMGVDAFRVDTVKHLSRLTLNTVFNPAFKEAGGDDFFMFGEVCTKGHDVVYRGEKPISTYFYTWDDDSSWKSKWSNSLSANEALVESHYTAMNQAAMTTSDNAFLNGNEYHTPDYSKSSGLSSIDFQMHWSFMSANSAFNTALGEDKYFNDSTWNVVYVDSHDYGPDECQTQRYTGGTDAWAENLSLMFTFRGIPCLYYGSEVEFQKGMPIDVGPNAPLSQTGRAYFGDYIEGTVSASDFTVFGNVSGKVQETLNATLSQHIMRLNRLRQAIPALRKGQYSTENCSGNMAFKRRYTDSKTDSFCLVAISGDATFTNLPGGTYVDAITGDTKIVSEGGSLTAKVSGKGNMKVYVLSTTKTPAPGRVIPNGDYLTDGGSTELIGPEAEIVEPTGISLDKTSVTILEGETAKVTTTVTPSNATNKSVAWSTSNASVATVSGGVITGVAAGTATITAKTSNGLTKTVKVTVNANPNIVKPTGVTISPSSLSLEAGQTQQLMATVTPSNATNKTVTWTSDNTAAATVDSFGNVKAITAGTAKITAATSNGITKSITVTVTEPEIDYYENGIYFEKPDSWGDNVYIYMFKDGTDLGSLWPGTKMTKIKDNVYGYEYLANTTGIGLVFNNGNGSKTDDFDFVQNGYYSLSGYVKTITPQSTGKVIVKYVDMLGNVLATTTLTGEVGTLYRTSAKNIDGYRLLQEPSNASGTYTTETITVQYVYEDLVITDIDAPNLSSAVNMKTGVGLTWSRVADASGYQVFRNGKIIKTLTKGTTVTYTDTTGLTGGTKYSYNIVAYKKTDSGTIKSSKSNTKSIVFIEAPRITETVNAAGGIKVCWNGGTGAQEYRLYVSANGGSYKQIAKVSAGTTSFLDTSANANGVRYQYKIIAHRVVSDTTYKSAWSSDVKTYYVGRPAIAKVASGSTGKITTVWNKMIADGYEVEYAKTSSFSSVVSATYSGDKRNSTISKLRSGTIYYVRVRAYKEVDGVKYYSKWSSTKYVKVQ